jgi:hypothetical protein
MHTLVVECFVLTAAETIDGFPVQEPRIPRVIDDGERQVMMVDVVFDVPPARETILD